MKCSKNKIVVGFAFVAAQFVMDFPSLVFAHDRHGHGHGRDDSEKICLTTDGLFRIDDECRWRRGEIEINASNLAMVADIGLAGIPPGQTVYGVIGGDYDSAGAASTWGTTSSLPAKVDPALTSADVIVVPTAELLSACGGVASSCLSAEEIAAPTVCTGSATTPSAPSGKLCIYPYTLTNTSGIIGVPALLGGANHGFGVNWSAPVSGDTKFAAVWAYTAP